MAAFWQVEGQQRVVKRPSVETNMRLLSPNKGATHGCVDEDYWARYAVEHRQAARSEATAEAEGNLGHPDSVATWSSSPGARIVQPCHRQQVARMRSGCASRPRCSPRQ